MAKHPIAKFVVTKEQTKGVVDLLNEAISYCSIYSLNEAKKLINSFSPMFDINELEVNWMWNFQQLQEDKTRYLEELLHEMWNTIDKDKANFIPYVIEQYILDMRSMAMDVNPVYSEQVKAFKKYYKLR